MISADELLDASYNEAVDLLVARAQRGERSFFVTPNVDHVVKLARDERFARVYREADFWFLDSAPLQAYYRLLGRKVRRVTGADLFMPLFLRILGEKLPVFLIVSNDAVAEALLSVCAKFGTTNVECVVAPPMFDPHSRFADDMVARLKSHTKPTNVFIGLGAPKQELLAHRFAVETTSAAVIACVGAAPEFAMGLKARAPKFMRRLGLEWLFRIWKEPRRLVRRYLWDDLAVIPILLGIVRLDLSKERKAGTLQA